MSDRYKWWYKGRTPEGITISLTGHVVAGSPRDAAKTVEREMRLKFPGTRWMHGREIEGDGVLMGPTVQKLKSKKAAPAAPAARCFHCEETAPLMEVTKGVAPVLPDAHGVMLRYGVNSIRLCASCFGAFDCRGEFVPDGEEAA